MTRHAKRRDDNEEPLVQLARQLGANWYADGPLDGWIYWRGRWTPVEIKRPDQEGRAHEFTPGQVEFLNQCRFSGAPFQIWRTADDVLQSLGAERRAHSLKT